MRLLAHDVLAEQPGIRAFPDAEAVFASAHMALARHLLPLVSIDLEAIGADLSGVLHAVVPLEPHEGRIGELTRDFHGRYLAPDWLSFRLDASNRYELMGDQRFFLLDSPARERVPGTEVLALENLYQARRTEYRARKARFRQAGELAGPLATQLGGADPLDNWPHLPEAYEPAGPTNAGTGPGLTIDGAPTVYIGEFAPYHFVGSGPTFLLMHFEPVSRIVSLHYDWS